VYVFVLFALALQIVTLYDVINFNDIIFALSSYEYGRNVTFTGV